MDISQAKKTQLELDAQPTAPVTAAGALDPRRVEHEGGALCTAIGSVELSKPKADSPKWKQPIPVEYEDLLR